MTGAINHRFNGSFGLPGLVRSDGSGLEEAGKLRLEDVEYLRSTLASDQHRNFRTGTHVHARSEKPHEEDQLEKVKEGDTDCVKDNLEAVDECVEDPVGEPLSDLAVRASAGAPSVAWGQDEHGNARAGKKSCMCSRDA